MAIAVTPFQPHEAEEWDALVWRARNGTLFHTRRFLSYHAPERFEDASLVFRDRHRMAAVMPAAIVRTALGPELVSHPGASFGGPVFDGLGARGIAAIVDALLGWAGGAGVKRVHLLRLAPETLRRNPSAELEYALYRAGFSLERRELASDLTLAAWHARGAAGLFSPSAMRAARKALKSGVEVRVTEDYPAYWSILEQTLSARHAAHPTHSVEDIQRLRALFPEHIHLFGAYLEGRLIAGVVVFVCNPVSAYTFYFAQDYDYQHLRPTDLIVLRIAEWAAARGMNSLHFGISTEDAGRVANWGLFRFKESFGAGGTLRDSYAIDL